MIIAVLAGALSLFAAYGFFKAGKFKATATKEVMLGLVLVGSKNFL